MTIANKLTIFRVLLIPIFLWAFYSPWSGSWPLSLVPLLVFVLASVTDWLDGYLARKRGEVTTFGKFMDPLADKLLVTAALVAFVDLGYLSGIVAIIIISREFIVTGLRLVAISDNKVIAAGFWGKLKTILQISVIIAILLLRISVDFDWDIIFVWIMLSYAVILQWSIWVMAAVTVISGFEYVWKNRGLLKSGGK